MPTALEGGRRSEPGETLMAIVTVAERRARELARLTTAVTTVTRELAGYVRSNSVRFVVFGSFARGDFDVVERP